MISVVIPVKDGGLDLVRCLEAIARQQVDEEVEVVVVDSGSTDGSVERARSLGARVHEILPQEFTHGGARNLGAELAAGDVVVFTSQDAYAADENWLAALVASLRERDDVAGVYGRQLPHASAIPSERYFLDFLYGPKPRTQRLTGPDRLSFEATLFSNVNSAVPRAVLERYPLATDVIMSEDQEWSRRVLEAGLVIVYEPRAAVRHSHAYTIAGRVPAVLRLWRLGGPRVRERVPRLSDRAPSGRCPLRAGRDQVALENRAPPLAPLRGGLRVGEVRRAPARAPTQPPPGRGEETLERPPGPLGHRGRPLATRGPASASSTTISSHRRLVVPSAGCATWRCMSPRVATT